MPWLYVAVGGAAGSLLRYAAGQALGPPRPGTFPWHTVWVNVAGSLLVGLVLALVTRDDPHHLRALLAVGFCGGLTTFSTFSWETVELLQSHAYGLAAAYVSASLLAGLLTVVGPVGKRAAGTISASLLVSGLSTSFTLSWSRTHVRRTNPDEHRRDRGSRPGTAGG